MTSKKGAREREREREIDCSEKKTKEENKDNPISSFWLWSNFKHESAWVIDAKDKKLQERQISTTATLRNSVGVDRRGEEAPKN
jgi:hypothetical protein